MIAFLLLCFIFIAGVGYWAYLKWVLPRPEMLLMFMVWLWPIVDYLNAMMLREGLNIHLRPLLFLTLGLPILWGGFKNRSVISSQIPWLKYYGLFFIWMFLYFLFNNGNASDPRLGIDENPFSEGSFSMTQLAAYFYCLAGIILSATIFLKSKNYLSIFDTLNKGLLWISGLEALMTIAGYPFGMFNQLLDGFTRSTGIFSHPNPFSHHMGILMVYLLGLFCYYQGQRQSRIPVWLLTGGLIINFLAFLLGLSKTAFGVFGLCFLILFSLNLAIPVVRKRFLQLLLGIALMIPLGVWGFQAVSGESFLSLMESRIDQTQSLEWRTMVWEDLLSDITPKSMWLGHGFTSANATVFRLTFNDAKNAQPLMMVHNAYIALMYDLGVMGYLMFVAALSLMLRAIKGGMCTEYSIALALAVYFLCVCGFDEMAYMFDAPMLFWILATALICLGIRERGKV